MSCHDIAGVWVASFQECQRYRCEQVPRGDGAACAPERLTGEERNAVRKEATALGYTAKSRGGGAERHLAVQKPPKGAAAPKRPAAAEPSSSGTAEGEKHEEKKQKTE